VRKLGNKKGAEITLMRGKATIMKERSKETTNGMRVRCNNTSVQNPINIQVLFSSSITIKDNNKG
jgi:hypothetical protein